MATSILLQSNCLSWAVASPVPPAITSVATPPTKITLQAEPAKLASAVLPTDTASDDTQVALKARIGTVDPDTAVSRVDHLTRQILLKEIELEKFNIHYKTEVTKTGRWRGLRYAAFQEANFSLNLANGIISTSERSSHFTNPKHVSANRLGNANLVGMTGSWIGAGAALLELGIIEFHDIQAHRHGFSTVAARKHVLDLKEQINQLLAERETLIQIEQSAPTLTGHAEVDQVEGKVLKDIRDLTLFEYARFHVGSRKYMAFQRTLYALDFSKFTCSALGSLFAYLALHKHDRKWNARAGALFCVSGGLIMMTPLISRAVGYAFGKIHENIISPVTKGTETKEIATLQADQAKLESLCKEGKCSADQLRAPIERAVVYHAQDKGFQDQLHQSLQEQRAGRLTATQNVLGGLFIGGTKLGSGILFTSVGYQHNGKSAKDSRITNYNLGTAAILATVGSGTAMLDTLRIQVKAEVDRLKMQRAGTLPSQLLKARLDQLDAMEQHLTAGSKTL
jgi:hypothetical protein